MEYAWIEVHHEIRRNPLGSGAVDFPTYEWKGEGDIAELHLSWFLHDGITPDKGVLTLGNLRLRVIDNNFLHIKVARDGWKARLYQAVWPVKRWWLWVWYRLILTLAVWGLATHEPGRIPSWRDIKVFKK